MHKGKHMYAEIAYMIFYYSKIIPFAGTEFLTLHTKFTKKRSCLTAYR
jgi:hypothetical protein